MRISIVIATKDRAAYLERAIATLDQQIGAPSFEIVVVDNGSTDATRDVVERAAREGRVPVRYAHEALPNRGKARNRGVEAAEGYLVLFCDDDVAVPPGFVAAHEAAHTMGDLVVNGPILNVPSYEERPRPSLANFSRAFLCTCNVSLPRAEFLKAGGFDEDFHLYGWEDTELGVRLRERGLRRAFAWDAYLWHIKPPTENTLETETKKAMEKARMAAFFVRKQPTRRSRLATGAYAANVLRGTYLLPDPLLAVYAGAASSAWLPAPLRALARAQFLDGMYTRELVRALRR
ncbi:MAG TPA: glycosyltransferase [Candidatus Tyrphobacter sp.]